MEFTQQLKQNQEHFTLALKKLRTGRAHPDMAVDIVVEAYGAHTPLSGLASTSVQDARTLLIEPWDKNIAKDIEKAIIAANRGLSASVSGSVIRVTIPHMTQENRIQAVKSLKETLEKARVSARIAREEEKKRIERAVKAGDLTEDDRMSEIKRLDEGTKQAVAALESAADEKEKELMQV